LGSKLAVRPMTDLRHFRSFTELRKRIRKPPLFINLRVTLRDYKGGEVSSVWPPDLLNLPNCNIYLKLMIDGTPSAAFSAYTTGVKRHDEMTQYRRWVNQSSLSLFKEMPE